MYLILFCIVSTLAAQELSTDVKVYPLIVQGQDAENGMFPWMVALYARGQYICSASLISDKLVLTAAHCIYMSHTDDPSDYKGHAGHRNRSQPGLEVEFEGVYYHPGYNLNGTGVHDLAILVTKQRVKFNDTIRPICLAKYRRHENYFHVLAMGWGFSDGENGFELKEVLQYAWINVIRREICRIIQKEVNEYNICAVGAICGGDSGGPLIALNRNNTPYQVGVTGYVNSVHGCGRLAVFARISLYQDYISNFTREFSTSVCYM